MRTFAIPALSLRLSLFRRLQLDTLAVPSRVQGRFGLTAAVKLQELFGLAETPRLRSETLSRRPDESAVQLAVRVVGDQYRAAAAAMRTSSRLRSTCSMMHRASLCRAASPN